MVIDLQDLVLEMSQWHQQFLVRNKYEPDSISPEQQIVLEEEWKLRTKYIPNDTFLLGVPFYDFQQPMWTAGSEKFFGNRQLSVIEFMQYVHPSILGCYMLMGQASYEMAARPEFKQHALKGDYSSKLELALRHYANNKYYSVIQYSEPILFDKNTNLLFHINSYRIGNELSPKELNRYMAQIIYGPVEKHDDYSRLLVREAGRILCDKLDEKEKLVAKTYLEHIDAGEKIKTAEIAALTQLTPRTITSVNEKLLRLGNTYLPFQHFTTAQKYLQFAYQHGFFCSEMLEGEAKA